MTDKAKERIQRACTHMIILRVKDEKTGEWAENDYQCADCPARFKAYKIMTRKDITEALDKIQAEALVIAPVLEESAT